MRHVLLRLAIGLVIAALLAGEFWPALLRSSSESTPASPAEVRVIAAAELPQFSRFETDGPNAGRAALDSITAADAIVVAMAPLVPSPTTPAPERPNSFHRATVHLRL